LGNYTLLQQTSLQNSLALVEGYFYRKYRIFWEIQTFTNTFKHLLTFLQTYTLRQVQTFLQETLTLKYLWTHQLNADKLFQNNLYSQVISRQVPRPAFEKMECIQDSSHIILCFIIFGVYNCTEHTCIKIIYLMQWMMLFAYLHLLCCDTIHDVLRPRTFPPFLVLGCDRLVSEHCL